MVDVERNQKERIIKLLENMKLPFEINANKAEVLNAMKKDKKREGENIHFVLLDGIGNAVVEEITIKELEEYFL